MASTNSSNPACFWIIFLLTTFLLSRSPASPSSTSGSPFPFIRDASLVPVCEKIVYYDYIIVGGGTAGSSLAATLSSKYRVLVLERGGSPYGNPNITRLEQYGAILADDGPESPLQLFFSTEGVRNGRPRVLGGGTSVNAGFYSRAEREFILGLSLNESLVEESYQWVESVVVSVPQRLGPYQVAYRASLLQAGVAPDNNVTYEHQVGTKTSGSIFDDSGNRRPASNLFVYADPSNLNVFLHATVQRIHFQGLEKKNHYYYHPTKPLADGVRPLRAFGVEYVDKLGRTHWALLSGKPFSEVIVCAGALGSPQVLMLSGVGPRNHLQAKGIPVILDFPEVGKHMADNPTISVFVPSPFYVEDSLTINVGITPFGSYIEAASGGTLAPNGSVVLQKANGPLSTGELCMNTTDASDNPIITFNYFSNTRDLDVCVGGLGTVEEVLLTEAFKPFRFDNQPLPSGGTVSSPARRNTSMAVINATLGDYCRRNVVTLHHYHGGCLVNKVVDSELKVLGAANLRVIDGSVFNTSPGTNPQATVLMLGRYMGQKIIREQS